MLKHILATTAVIALVSSPALAADNTDKAMPVFSSETTARTATGAYFTADKSDMLASNFLGATVYNGAGDDAEAIGDVNDVVLGANGSAEAVIIGVGGFVGIGEKDVAVDFDQLSWKTHDGERWLVVNATKAELESAPAYERTVLETDTRTRTNMVATTPRTDGQPVTMNDPKNLAAQKMSKDADPRDNLKMVDRGGIRAETLIGARVYGANNDDIGEIGDVILTADGQIETLIIDVGGFLGIGEKEVAVALDKLELMTDSNESIWVFTPYTEEQLEAHAEYSEEDYKNNPDTVILR